jgi:hypothetical protein
MSRTTYRLARHVLCRERARRALALSESRELRRAYATKSRLPVLAPVTRDRNWPSSATRSHRTSPRTSARMEARHRCDCDDRSERRAHLHDAQLAARECDRVVARQSAVQDSRARCRLSSARALQAAGHEADPLAAVVASHALARNADDNGARSRRFIVRLYTRPRL